MPLCVGPSPVPAKLLEVVGVQLVDRQVEGQVLRERLPPFADVLIEERPSPEDLLHQTARSVSSANHTFGTPSSQSSRCLPPMV